jgi:mannose-6-phosphate isomerase
MNGSSLEVAPFRIEPAFVGRIWGFSDLRPWYDKAATGEPIGEVWLTGDACRIATGPYQGRTLAELFSEVSDALLGDAAPTPESPLLIKIIFAREKLSVQVHPDDKLARKYGQPRGKTECWYALAAEPGAQVAVGLKPGVTLEAVKDEIREGTLEQSLNVVPISAGDLIFVDAGTVHAIWPGSILLEAQQNCDLTYRMFDYGRPRELHIDKSIEATRLKTDAGKLAPRVLGDRTVLVDVGYFRLERFPENSLRSSESFRNEKDRVPGLSYLFAAAGDGRITGSGFDPVELPARGIVAIPASSPHFVVEDLGGLELIRITPNWPREV